MKNDPTKPSEWIKGGGGYGQLTPEGMKEQLILGKKLRNRYIDSGFMSQYYDSRQIFIRSTDTNRTINSAFANMLGMYSSGGRAGLRLQKLQISENLNFQELTILKCQVGLADSCQSQFTPMVRPVKIVEPVPSVNVKEGIFSWRLLIKGINSWIMCIQKTI